MIWMSQHTGEGQDAERDKRGRKILCVGGPELRDEPPAIHLVPRLLSVVIPLLDVGCWLLVPDAVLTLCLFQTQPYYIKVKLLDGPPAAGIQGCHCRLSPMKDPAASSLVTIMSICSMCQQKFICCMLRKLQSTLCLAGLLNLIPPDSASLLCLVENMNRPRLIDEYDALLTLVSPVMVRAPTSTTGSILSASTHIFCLS
ncbi:hypothetical protein KQX54_017250 [Cotesia glomerata]|uniref:Uncharacterized protein n=1 Tax=Cotesia glomerata TaxID=32391 RepID=A0AAV7IBB9_COTGL|nr:hypothetical protein KQX54_017250 [Cotesia glomerata]